MSHDVSLNVRLTADASKEDEVGVMRKLQDGFAGSNLYLADLFTSDLTAWVEQQIRNDFMPDVMEEVKRRNEEAEKSVAVLNLKMKEARSEEFARVTAAMKPQIETAEREARELEEKNEKLQFALRESDERLSEREREVFRMKTEITNLKARMFDLMEEVTRLKKEKEVLP